VLGLLEEVFSMNLTTRQKAIAAGAALVAALAFAGCSKKPEPDLLKPATIVTTLAKPGDSAEVKSGEKKATFKLLRTDPSEAVVEVGVVGLLRKVRVTVHANGKPTTDFIPGGHALTASADTNGVQVQITRP
jgi:hypothetical protein